jgi:lactate oxidase
MSTYEQNAINLSRRGVLKFAGAGLAVTALAASPVSAQASEDVSNAAIQVSNHGGRALDGTPAAITVLPSISEVVKGEVPLILDSGIRRGTDVVKALALGANAVAIGRPVMFGLALGGTSGVDSVINYLRSETVNTLLHLGASRLGELRSEHVSQAAAPGIHGPVSVGAERLG